MMKKFLVIALVFAFLLTAAAFAEENNDSQVKFNIAARYYPVVFYSTNAPDYNLSTLFLEGNLFVGKNKKWKGSIEYFGGKDTERNIELEANSITGRVGYDLWEHLYLTVDYKSTQLKMAGLSNTFNGIGFGLEKDFQAGPHVPIFVAIHYYPTLDGPRDVKFRVFEYEAMVKYQMPKAVDLSIGYKAENWDGYNNASNINAGFRGPYFGVSKEF